MDPYNPPDWTKHPLHVAAMSGNKTAVEELIAKGANVDENLCVGTPLHVAICECGEGCYSVRYCEVVGVLLAAGADFHLSRRWAGTPLHDAAQRGLDDFAQLLISHGADVNSNKHHEGATPLHLAAVSGRLEMINYLLSKGAEIDAVATEPMAGLPISRSRKILGYNGMTPLDLAARKGLVPVVTRLVERGATLHMREAINLASESRRGLQSEIGRFDQIISLLSSRALE